MFDIPIPFRVSSNSELDRLVAYYYRRLFQSMLSVYDWSGSEFETGEMNAEYLEFKLMTMGFACLTEIEDKKRCTEITRVGYDFYGLPTFGEIVNPTLSKSIKKYFGKDCILVKNNKLMTTSVELLKHYAKILAQSELSFRTNLENSTNTGLYIADNDPQAQQIRAMLDQKAQGEPNVLVKRDLAAQIMNPDKMQIPYIGTPSNFISDKLVQIQTKIYDEFYYQLGIDSNGGNQLKASYNSIDEVNQNNQQILVNRAYWLEPRQQACEQFNKMFGTNISVNVREGKVTDYGRISDQTEPVEGQE